MSVPIPHADDALQKLLSGVDRSGGPNACWPWVRFTDKHGYGRVWVGSRTDGSLQKIGTHVLAYRLTFGDPPADKPYILHTCDNPSCCNPNHLWTGTQADNLADMAAKRRGGGSRRTHCPQGHPYDEANTRVTNGKRYCRTCSQLQSHHRKEG